MARPTATRVPRHSLTRERILTAAEQVLDEGGLDGVTIRSVAAHLGATPMALYTHVQGKDDLLAGMREVIWGRVPQTQQEGLDGLQQLWLSMWRVAREHPRAAALLTMPMDPSDAEIRTMDNSYRIALETGLSAEGALLLTAVLSRFILGSLLVYSSVTDQERNSAPQRVQGLADRQHPSLRAVAEAAQGISHDRIVEHGLRQLLDAHIPAPPRSRKR